MEIEVEEEKEDESGHTTGWQVDEETPPPTDMINKRSTNER